MFITRGQSLGFIRWCTHTHTHAHTLSFFYSSFSRVFLSCSLRGIYRDVKAVIGQVSGVELSDNRLVTVAAHEWGMERRRETGGIETLNSLLNQKVNWKSEEFRLPAETDRASVGEGGNERGGRNVSERGGLRVTTPEGQWKCEWAWSRDRAYYHSQGARCLFLNL